MHEASIELFESNLHLAEKTAHKFMRMSKSGIEFDDLHQEALISLDDASKKYDPNKGIRFANYALQKMHLDLVSWLYKQNAFYTPRNILLVAGKIKKHNLKKLSIEEISEKLNSPKSVVVSALNHLNQQSLLSLEAPVKSSNEIEEILLVDTIVNMDNPNEPLFLDFKIFVSNLDKDKQSLLLGMEQGFNMVEMAKQLGVSSPTVRKRLDKTLKMFKERMGSDLVCN